MQFNDMAATYRKANIRTLRTIFFRRNEVFDEAALTKANGKKGNFVYTVNALYMQKSLQGDNLIFKRTVLDGLFSGLDRSIGG